MFTFSIMSVFFLSCFFFTHLPPWCYVLLHSTASMCKYFKADAFFFPSSFSTRTWCLFVFSLILCHCIRYYASLNFLWAINSYCMVLYQSLMYNICITFLSFATAVRWSRHHPRWFLTPWISHFFDEQSETWTKHTMLEKHPSQNAVTICSLAKEKSKTKTKTNAQAPGFQGRPRGDPCAQSVRIWEQCHIHVTISFPNA